MPHKISFVDNTNQLAHYEMIAAIRSLALANGWTEKRYDTSGERHELILCGEGLGGDDEIYVGFRTYHSVTADYYNITAAMFTGYVEENSFSEQPGAFLRGVPCHNQRVDYWMSVNAQRIALVMKVGTPVYECCYVGKFLPYATPSQYPYPVVCAGMLDGEPATRFSDSNHIMPWNSLRNLRTRFVDGSWKETSCWPWSLGISFRDNNTVYSLLPAVLYISGNVFGELDGIAHIGGFNNIVENTINIDGVTWLVFQNVSRTGFHDYFSMRMDP